jgi:Kef-type K+ transport system membrane component KefB
MNHFPLALADLSWPLSLLIAWSLGEFMHRKMQIPRIAMYAVCGFVLAQTGLLAPSSAALLLANIAFGLILFETGHRINLRWLGTNRWLALSSVLEASLSFGLVYALCKTMGFTTHQTLLLAALSMATSPATLIRVVNEQRANGQVTERTLHLSAFNCVLSVFVFNIVVGLVVFETSGSLWQASYSSLVVLLISALLGIVAGVAMPLLLRALQAHGQDSTLVFAIAVILLVTLTHSLQLSPVLATLCFGLVARHRRVVLGHAQRGFGVLGDLFSLILFVFVASCISWASVQSGLAASLAILAVRQLAKIAGTTLLARLSGITWRKGLLTGVGMAPLSALIVLSLEQTRHLNVGIFEGLAPLAAMALILEIAGPLLLLHSLRSAREIPVREP